MPHYLVILAALSSVGFAQDPTTYDDHVFPILQQSCLNCHNPDKAKGGLDLSSFAATLKGGSGGKIVEPGDASSALIAVVRQSGEKKMPPEGDPLGKEQIESLVRWISGGLLETKASAARKPSKPKFETALRSDPAAKPDGPPPMPAHLLLEPPVLTARPAAIHALVASPWAPLLAITGQRQVLLYHTDTLELTGILPFPEGEPISLAFAPDGRYLIVGGGVAGKSGITITFDITTGARLLSAAKEFDTVLAADIRPGFDLVATGGPSRLLKIWNTETGELVKSIKKHTDWITALDLSADGVLLASGDRNGGAWVWESESANEFHTLRGHQAAITATIFRADSNLLATASEDGSVRFWEMNGGSEVKKLDAHPGGVTAFAFGRDGSSISAGRDCKAKLWKPDFSHARDLASDLPALPTAVALDHDGKRAFIADAQGVVRVVDTTDSKPVGEIRANPPSIEARLKELKPESTAHKFWSAAAINARALATRRVADDVALAVEDSFVGFSRHAQAVTDQAAALDLKRDELRRISTYATACPETAEEVNATAAAVEISLARGTQLLRQAENQLLELREGVDESAPRVHEKDREAEALGEAYRKALE